MRILNFPLVFALLSFIALWFSVRVGVFLHKKRNMQSCEQEYFGIIVAATLTLLGLILGFSFSMTITRYDLRQSYEEAEANAMSTEYVRAGLLSADDAAKVRALLRSYLEQRILFYRTRNSHKLQQINATTSQLQADLWSEVRTATVEQPTALMALVVSGMNDVINSQGRTQGAWWNRIPSSAWVLAIIIAICSNVLLGFGADHAKLRTFLTLVLPFLVAISFFLIADIDSPRGGIIRLTPKNLMSFSKSLDTR